MQNDEVNDLVDRRLRLRLTQKRLADLAGVDQPRVSRAEQGRAPQETIERLRGTLDELERQRDTVRRAQSEEMWRHATTLPFRTEVIDRIVEVARELLMGSLADAELADRLLDCVPEATREQVYAENPDLE